MSAALLAATDLLPDAAGDVWSVLLAAVGFALLFAALKGLDRI